METEFRIEGAEADSSQVDLLLFDAEVAWTNGNPRRAVNQLQMALNLDPNRLEVHTELARILTAVALEGNMDDAAQVARQALKHWDVVLNQVPGLEEAQQAKRELARRFSDGNPGLTTHRGRLAYDRGKRALDSGRYSIAADAFREVLDVEPRALGIHRLLGDSLRGLEQFEGAENAYRKSLALNDQDAAAYFGLALALEAQGENEEARRRYLQAFEQDAQSHQTAEHVVRLTDDRAPDEFEVEDRVTIGRAYLRTENTKQAIRFLNSAVQDYAPPIYRKYLGMAYYFDHDAKNAVDQLSVAHQHRPDDLELMYYLGASYLAAGDQERGRYLLSQVLQKDPRNPNALKLLGANLAEEPGREHEAEKMLMAAVRFGANIPRASLPVGRSCSACG